MSRYQWIAIVAVCMLAWTELMNQTAVFFSAVPTHRCKIPDVDENACEDSNLTMEERTKVFIPYNDETQAYDECHRYDINLSDCNSHIGNASTNIIGCDHGYIYDTAYYESTTISEWDLVCDRRILDSVAIAIYFAGVAVGSVGVGVVMDWLGRKFCMLIFAVNIVLFGTLTAFAKSYETYLFFRFMTGVSDNIYIAVFAYVTEVSNAKSRSVVEIYTILFAEFSHIALPGIAYATRDWRKIGLIASIIPSAFFVLYFFIPESPKWLIATGRDKQAKKFYEKSAKSNGTVLREEDWNTAVEFERRKQNLCKKKYSILDLFRRKYIRAITLNSLFVWFAIDSLFEGLTINVVSLAGDPYINSTLNAVVEWLAYVAFALVIIRANKKRLLLSGSLALAGLCCFISIPLYQFSHGNQVLLMSSTAFAIAGKFFATVAYTSSWVLTNELFPTVVRGAGMSVAAVGGRIGTMTMPFILLLQNDIPWLTQTVFGAIAMCAAFSSLIYPDTSTLTLLNGLQEAEKFYAENMHVLNKII